MNILRRGDKGGDVVTLQTALLRAGYSPGRADGVFGPNTEDAVKKFQRAMGLTVDGIVGSRTWAALAPYMETPVYPPIYPPVYPPEAQPDTEVLKLGDRGPRVTTLQQALSVAGYDIPVIDGVFGSATQAAVIKFQKVFGLPATGVTDAQFWSRLSPFITEPDGAILRRGSVGTKVTNLQNALLRVGFSPGTIDGLFGTRTQAAVQAFQSAYGLPVTGVVDAATGQALGLYYPGYTTYIVQRGDTLYSIARRFNTTVAALLQANPRTNPNLIYVGERLIIPGY